MHPLRGLRAQIILWTILPLILVLIVVSVGSINVHQQSMRRLVAERDERLVEVAATRLDDSFRERTLILQTVLADAGEGASAPDGRGQVSSTPDHFDLGTGLFDGQDHPTPQGAAAAAPSSTAGVVPSLPSGLVPESLLAAARRQAGTPVVVMVTGGESEPAVLVALADTKSEAVTVGASSIQAMGLPALMDELKAGPRATAFLVDRSGRAVYHPDATLLGRDLLGNPASLGLETGRAGTLFQHVGGGEEHVIGYAPINTAGWYLVVEEPWADMIEPILQYTLMAPLVVLVAAIFSLAAVYFGLRRIVQPLQTLGHRASRLAWGDFEAIQAPVGGIGEIEELQLTLQEMAEQVRRYQAGMQDYIGALTHAQEEERRRLARELHDETVQSLVALYQRVKLLEAIVDEREAQAATNGSAVRVRLTELSTMVSRTLDEVRQLIRALRPIYLEELGLVPALEMLVKGTQRDGLAVRLEIEGTERRLPADVELAVYRIAQEGLHNVVRHAEAGQADLGLAFADEGVTLTVEDDGAGFVPPETPNALAADGHFGLMGMYERATRVGGHLSIRSAPGAGTKVVAFIPCRLATPPHVPSLGANGTHP